LALLLKLSKNQNDWAIFVAKINNITFWLNAHDVSAFQVATLAFPIWMLAILYFVFMWVFFELSIKVSVSIGDGSAPHSLCPI
jgi:hypothetical protein